MHHNGSRYDVPRPNTTWLSAPPERSADFFPAFARISVALQSALRNRVPAVYFENLENYRDTQRAYPMLVYRASRPFRARMRTELNYDVLNPAALARVYRSAKQFLPVVLEQTEARLANAGLGDVARHYRAKRTLEIVDSVQRLSKSRRYLYVIIRSEGVLMNALIELGGLGALNPRQQAHRIAAFEKRWTFQLKRLYPGTDFLGLAPDLMNVATAALGEFLDRSAAKTAAAVTDAEERL